MGKDDNLELNGVVKECYPNTTFLVKLENGHDILAYLAGKLRKHYIRVLPGDHVRLQISPYDLTKGRITRRYTKPPRPEELAAEEAEANKEE
jgi:translation initiation factor IF-1